MPRLFALAALWLLLTKFAGPSLRQVLPAPLLGRLDLPTFSILAQAATTVLGLGLGLFIVGGLCPPPRWQSHRGPTSQFGAPAPNGRFGTSFLAILGFARPSKLAMAMTALLAPALFVVVSTVALNIAMPWLLEELAQGRVHASRENAGELGRALQRAPLLTTLLWGALFAAIAEELCFRGAVWTFAREALLRFWPRAERLSGAVATVTAAALFGFMHADMPGGVGIVRIVATTMLGLFCGLSRQLSGAVLAPMLLHFAYNALSLGVARKWFDDGSAPLVGVLPNPLLALAAVGIAISMILLRVSAMRHSLRMSSREDLL